MHQYWMTNMTPCGGLASHAVGTPASKNLLWPILTIEMSRGYASALNGLTIVDVPHSYGQLHTYFYPVSDKLHHNSVEWAMWQVENGTTIPPTLMGQSALHRSTRYRSCPK